MRREWRSRLIYVQHALQASHMVHVWRRRSVGAVQSAATAGADAHPLANGETVIESFAILDWLDETVGADRALIASQGPEPRAALKNCALATGLADKAVSLHYEHILHKEVSDIWISRCRSQIADVLAALDADRANRSPAWWFGDSIGHADIAVACAIRFTREAHAALFDLTAWPALNAHAGRCEALGSFRKITQPLNSPKGA